MTDFVADEAHGSVLVGRETDFRPLFEGPDPLLSHLHTCPDCRYSAYREGFETEPSDEDELIEPVEEDPRGLPKPQVGLPYDDEIADLRRYCRSDEIAEGLLRPQEVAFGGVRYLLAGRIHEYLTEDESLAAAHYYLRAAWSARATGSRELERLAFREVLLKLNPLLEGDSLSSNERLRLQYLAGECARRMGDFGRAIEFFAQVEKDADLDEEEDAFLAALTRRQTLLAHVKSDVNAVFPSSLSTRQRRRDEELEDSQDEDEGEDSLN
jgi:uncharacterized protein (DUF2225 family)